MKMVFLKLLMMHYYKRRFFLKQKSKIQWFREGDCNSGYFHRVVKGKQNRSRIQVIKNNQNELFHGEAVPNGFVSHYESFLGLSYATKEI